MIRYAHAASHVPSDTAGDHDTPSPVLVRPRGRVFTSESGVRKHKPPFSVFVSNKTNTNKNDHQSGMWDVGGSQSASLRRTQSPPFFKFADLSKLSARFGRFRPSYCHSAWVVRVIRVKNRKSLRALCKANAGSAWAVARRVHCTSGRSASAARGTPALPPGPPPSASPGRPCFSYEFAN